MIYLDTSALAKLVVAEPESAALAAWLGERRNVTLVTSVIGLVEVRRAVRRVAPTAVAQAEYVCAAMDMVPLSERILESAGVIGPAELRTLDAIHLASAQALGAALTEVVTYDRRLHAGCTALGITVMAPGELSDEP